MPRTPYTPRRSSPNYGSTARKLASLSSVKKKSTVKRRLFKKKSGGRKWSKAAIAKYGKKKYTRRQAKPATQSTMYGGKFPSTRRYKDPIEKFRRYGSVHQKEIPGTCQSTSCQYLIHGTPLDECFISGWRAVYRRLLKQAGLDFADWYNPMLTIGWRLKAYYTVGQGTTVLDITGNNIIAGDTYQSNFSDWITQLRATIIAAETEQTVTYQQIELQQPGVGAGYYHVASLPLTYFGVEVYFKSTLKVKNISLANDALDGDMIDNIEAQPLVGKIYRPSKWANGLVLGKRLDSAVGASNMVVDPLSGVREYDVNQLYQFDDVANPYRKPPPAYMFGCKKETKVRMDPGALKTDTILWTAKMGFNRYMTHLRGLNDKDSGTIFGLYNFGTCSLIGLEREVRIGTPTNQIKLAYQVDWTLACMGYSTPVKLNPLTFAD